MRDYQMNTHKKKLYLSALLTFSFIFLMNVAAGYAQNTIPVKGKVTDLDGKRVPVSIRFKGGMSTTDMDGNFEIKLKNLADTLWFSALGYKKIYRTVAIENAFLIVKMTESVSELAEVVVQTGYQTVKPNELNGSVSVIDEKMLQSRSGTNILDRLIGQSSGLLLNIGKTNGNPQNNTNISIRGLGTINGPLDPLIVLDGFIYEGNIENINPNDIENVTILKDAAAASIWGARAGNGVIVLTTKKGKLNQPLRLSANVNYILQDLPDIGAINQMSNTDYINVERQLFNAGFFNGTINAPYLALTPAVEVLMALRGGKINQAIADQRLADLSNGDTRQSYLDNFYTNALTQQYTMNMNGGGARNSYFFSGAYDRVKGASFERNDKVNFHFSNDFKVLKNLELQTNIYYTQALAKSGRPTYGSQTVGGRSPSYLNFADPIGIAKNYRAAYTDTIANGKFLDWKYYPTEEYQQSYSNTKTQEFFANVGIKYELLAGLNLQLSYQYQRQDLNADNTAEAGSFTARNLVNTYSQYNAVTGVVKYVVPKGGILQQSFQTVSSQTARAQFNFNKIVGLHSINAILGAEERGSNTDASALSRFGYVADPLVYTNVDVVGSYPQYLTGNYSELGGDGPLSRTHYRFMSLYTNFAYSFKGRYTLSGSARRDGSNIFGANTNDQWKPLWSAGLDWKIADEPFYDLKWLPVLRFSASYGQSGNVDLSRTALPIVSYSTQPVTKLPYTRIRTINNPDLSWEQLSQLNFKLDFELEKQRLTGSFAYYIKQGTDLYGNTPYDYTKWGDRSVLVLNVADMVGKGFDIDLHSNNINRNSFSWHTDLYLSYNLSKTKKYYNRTGTSLYGLLSGGNIISPVEGRPLYSIAAYQWGGLDANGNPQGYLNGMLSTNYAAMASEAATTGTNLDYIGNASPLYFGSLINSFKWKNFTLALNVSYKLGYQVRKPAISYDQLISYGVGQKDFASRWQQPGDEKFTNIPSFVYPNVSGRDSFYYNAAVNTMSGSHIRLDYVKLGYVFSTAQWQFPFRNLELFTAIQNVGILWKANTEGYDPDYARVGTPSRQITFGLRGSF